MIPCCHQQIADASQARWEVHRIAICHRVGRLEIGEAAVLIAVSAAHRKASKLNVGHKILAELNRKQIDNLVAGNESSS